MPKPVYPDHFDTHVDDSVPVPCIRISDHKTDELLAAYDLRWLSNKLLNGQICNRQERAAAGAAISHFLATLKGKR